MLAPRKFRSQNARRRQRIRVALFVTAGGILFTLCCGGSAWVLAQPYTRVSDIAVEGVSSISPDDVRVAIRNNLDGRALWFLPRDSILLVRHKALEAAAAAAFPRARTVTVEQSGLRRLLVRIEERTPEALWCGDVVPPAAYNVADTQHVEVWGTCYLMDNASFIFARAPIYTGDVLPRYYGPLTKGEPVGQAFLAEEEYRVWASLRGSLNDLGYPLTAMLIVDEQEVEAYLENGTKLLLGRDLEADRAVVALAALTEHQLLGRDRPLEYVDLRWNNKVYYKPVGAHAVEVRGEGG